MDAKVCHNQKTVETELGGSSSANAFQLLDKDQNGILSVDDLMIFSRENGLFPSRKELAALMSEITGNDNDYVRLNEFSTAVANLNGSPSLKEEEEELQLSFQLFNSSGTGYITAGELRKVVQSIIPDATDEEVNDMMAEVDIYEDDMIDFENFMRLMKEEVADNSYIESTDNRKKDPSSMDCDTESNTSSDSRDSGNASGVGYMTSDSARESDDSIEPIKTNAAKFESKPEIQPVTFGSSHSSSSCCGALSRMMRIWKKDYVDADVAL